jgi:hypothetical protein
MTTIAKPSSETPSGLVAVTLGRDRLHGEVPGERLSAADCRLLRASFERNLAQLALHLHRPTTHVFVPLGSPEEGHHVAFQGPFGYADLVPFFRKTPNALTVVDGRPYGYLRFRLIHLDGEHLERIADLEVSLAHDAPSVGFELVWAPSEREPLRVIRFVQRQGEAAVQQVSRLVAEWGTKFRLIKAYPDLQRSLALR